MAEGTGIEWTDNTYNPWRGCSKVSPGCAHCYAETMAHGIRWGDKGERKPTKKLNEPRNWNTNALKSGKRITVFCASMADVFEGRPELVPLRHRLWKLVRDTPALDWMMLTKRAENIATMLPSDWGNGYANVCLMVSVENQKYFDERVPLLQAVPAKFRALSVEPLLGALEIAPGSLKGIDLVIVGGESGWGARPMHPDWVRGIRDACEREGVAFFFKQWGNWSPEPRFARPDLRNAVTFEDVTAKPIKLAAMPERKDRKAALQRPNVQAMFSTFDKYATGSELDGQTHKAHPFKDRPLEAHLKALQAASAASKPQQGTFDF